MLRNNIKDNIFDILEGKIKIHYCTAIRNNILKNNIFKYECIKCKLINWEGERLSLEINHIDGDKLNNSKENLELLCPNCHSLTSNYRSKKGKNNKEFYSDEKIIKEIEKGGSVNQILKNLELSNSGGNYKRIYEICRKNKILIPQKLTHKPKYYKEKKLEIIDNKINKIQEKINIIFNSKINFDKRGWNIEVSKLLNITPQAVKQWMIREMPDFYKNCYHQIDNNISS